ncbi:hypothetical protein P167DRAFT_540633 [Morchella conica CCBAS932]|uniref:Uncharacterized protein n=1 Tax=Morchella conica CCBAS932 TaxID=1392247 RepID=A0A3N4K839_9PEZI|nr:hypothetical protein P167DRAFT_540633 [Morchella conica CCBAS932]
MSRRFTSSYLTVETHTILSLIQSAYPERRLTIALSVQISFFKPYFILKTCSNNTYLNLIGFIRLL